MEKELDEIRKLAEKNYELISKNTENINSNLERINQNSYALDIVKSFKDDSKKYYNIIKLLFGLWFLTLIILFILIK